MSLSIFILSAAGVLLGTAVILIRFGREGRIEDLGYAILFAGFLAVIPGTFLMIDEAAGGAVEPPAPFVDEGGISVETDHFRIDGINPAYKIEKHDDSVVLRYREHVGPFYIDGLCFTISEIIVTPMERDETYYTYRSGHKNYNRKTHKVDYKFFDSAGGNLCRYSGEGSGESTTTCFSEKPDRKIYAISVKGNGSSIIASAVSDK